MQHTFKEHKPGPAGYTVSVAILIQVYGIFYHNLGIKYLVFPTC